MIGAEDLAALRLGSERRIDTGWRAGTHKRRSTDIPDAVTLILSDAGRVAAGDDAQWSALTRRLTADLKAELERLVGAVSRRHATRPPFVVTFVMPALILDGYVEVLWLRIGTSGPDLYDIDVLGAPVRVTRAPANGLEVVAAEKAARAMPTEPRGHEGRDTGAEEPVEAAIEATPDDRRLIANSFDGTTKLTKALPPKKKLSLRVKIAIPEADDHWVGFMPITDAPLVTLEVTVRFEVGGKSWRKPRPQEISFETNSVASSDEATFTFSSPAEGKVITAVIDIGYAGRLLQSAVWKAPVRTKPADCDEIHMCVYQTSAGPAPRLDATAAMSQLDARDEGRLRSPHGEVTLDLRGILDAVEQVSSATLGLADAPNSLAADEARRLLISLARMGFALRRQLEPLQISPGTIAVQVGRDSRIVPLELVYDATVAPLEDAVLCDHVTNPPPGGSPCDKASASVVCPYAFWGLTRTIIRDVVRDNEEWIVPPRHLSLRPVTYAATARADDGSPPDALPSAMLQRAAEVFDPVARAKTWDDWKAHVANDRPQMLLLLAHTDKVGLEESIEIRQDPREVLKQLDITSEYLHAHDAPPPLVLLIACGSLGQSDPFGTLHGALTACGAAAVVGLLTQLNGVHGAHVGEELIRALHKQGTTSLASALTDTRRALLAQGLLTGLLVVAHGEIDIQIGGGPC
jgi:hypothetical protein